MIRIAALLGLLALNACGAEGEPLPPGVITTKSKGEGFGVIVPETGPTQVGIVSRF
ncbi:hypothetical protein [Ostreiculturibacter nitratireducens]|uniref:hypothetical protein n=1 Tax=Ostreiculturibacter nitratireducens TaxID=3075226 RepID=UPI0031B63413